MPQIVGVFNGEGPPVPIPNTEVKLTSADNTCLETDREDRSMPTQKTATKVAVFLHIYGFAVHMKIACDCECDVDRQCGAEIKYCCILRLI